MRPYSPGGLLNTFASAVTASEPPRPSRHRLQRGLPGYLILFAPHAFVSQRQDKPSVPSSPLAFLLISTHSTAPPRVPYTPTCLKKSSSSSNSSVKPRDFTKTLTFPPTHALSPVIPNNACHLRLTAAAGTKLAVTSSGVDQSIRRQTFLALTVVYIPKNFILHAASLRQAFAHCAIFVTAALRGGPGSVSVPMLRANL